MEEIARVAGISKARMYHLFAGRREVFAEVVAEDARTLAGEVVLESAMAPDLPGKIRSIVDVFFRFVQRKRHRHRILYTEADSSEPELAELLLRVRGALAENLTQQLAAALPQGGERARLMAHAVIAMAEGSATAWGAGPHIEMDRAVLIVTELALNALGIERVAPA